MGFNINHHVHYQPGETQIDSILDFFLSLLFELERPLLDSLEATFILQVVRNPDDDSLIKAFVDSYDFVFMPVLNPDGLLEIVFIFLNNDKYEMSLSDSGTPAGKRLIFLYH